MLQAVKASPERLAAISRIEEWTRERFGLARDEQVHVWEIACVVPGCPPVETAVLFWIEEQRYQFKVFKQLQDVGESDLPPAWFRSALAVAEGIDCDCC